MNKIIEIDTQQILTPNHDLPLKVKTLIRVRLIHRQKDVADSVEQYYFLPKNPDSLPEMFEAISKALGYMGASQPAGGGMIGTNIRIMATGSGDLRLIPQHGKEHKL